MKYKKILFGGDARSKLKLGMDKLAGAVRVTHGAKGRTVMIGDARGHRITKDGVTVSENVVLEDVIEDLGAQYMKRAAKGTVDKAGDGTTAAIVLAHAIITAGMNLVKKKWFGSNINPIQVKKGIDKAVETVVDHLKKMAIPCEGFHMYRQVATISANNDIEIGNMVAEAYDKIGRDGKTMASISDATETTLRVLDGMEVHGGYLSPFFVNSPQKMTTEYEDVLVVICDKTLSDIAEFIPLADLIFPLNKPVLFICEAMQGAVLGTIVQNILGQKIRVCAIKIPEQGNFKAECLADLAVLTGATVISEDMGLKISEVEMKHIGFAQKIVVEKNKTMIVGSDQSKEKVKQKVFELKAQLETCEERYKERLTDRIARLTGGVAFISVGATSLAEKGEKKDRVDDAIKATECAIQEGIVPGGGVALIRCLDALSELVMDNSDQQAGVELIKSVLDAPLRQMCDNGGLNSQSIIDRVRELDGNIGYDFRSGEYVDLVSFGVTDPVKVVRVSLENAAAVAGIFLTTECVMMEVGNEA